MSYRNPTYKEILNNSNSDNVFLWDIFEMNWAKILTPEADKQHKKGVHNFLKRYFNQINDL